MGRLKKPIEPTHVEGIAKGEEAVINLGREPGRGTPSHYRSARDSTSINPRDRDPIHPAMPNIPPA